MDELIEVFETATLEQATAAKEKSDKAALDAEKGLEMRRMSMESMGESSKRKANDDGKGKEKRVRRTASDTFQYNERISLDVEWKKKEFESKERELEEKAKKREYKELKLRQEDESRGLEAIHSQLERHNEMLMQIHQQLQQQNALILTIIEDLNQN